MKSSSVVLVFGVFDKFHPGHLSFLRQAKKRAEKLIIVVARDEVVKFFKGRQPQQNERARLAAIKKLDLACVVILGDREQGSYRVVKKYRPDAIGIGYDQGSLARDLAFRIKNGLFPKTKLIKLKPFKSNHYHSSLLAKTRK